MDVLPEFTPDHRRDLIDRRPCAKCGRLTLRDGVRCPGCGTFRLSRDPGLGRPSYTPVLVLLALVGAILTLLWFAG